MNLVLNESLPFVGSEKYMHKKTVKYRRILYVNYQEWLTATNPNKQEITMYRNANNDIQFMIDYMNHKYDNVSEAYEQLNWIYFEYIAETDCSIRMRSVFADGIKLRCPEHADYILSGNWYTGKKYSKKDVKEIGKLKNITNKEAKALLDLEARKH